MAFVPGYDHDIFVSYAHVDDVPLIPNTEGWVTTFVRGLKNILGRRLGRADAFSLWMDHELEPHARFSPQIMQALERTAVLVVVLSPGYIASTWCLRERNYEGPPESKDQLDFMVPGMQILDCRKGLRETELISFLAATDAEHP